MVHPVSPSVVTESESSEEHVSGENIIESADSGQNIESSVISLLSEHDEDSSFINDEQLEGAVGFSTDSLELGAATAESDILVSSSLLEDSNIPNILNDGTPRFRRNSCLFSCDADKTDELSPQRTLNNRFNERARRDTVDSGVLLFHGFMRDEFRRQNIPEPVFFNSTFQPEPTLSTSLANDVIEASNQLRHLSESFANSPLRNSVLAQAHQVDLQSLTMESFSDILYGLFQEGGVTWERVIVLFFFCADVSLRAVREKLFGQFANILHWSIRFFSLEVFVRWVQDNGGWIKLLQTTIDHTYKVAVIGLCTIGIIALAALIWKSK